MGDLIALYGIFFAIIISEFQCRVMFVKIALNIENSLLIMIQEMSKFGKLDINTYYCVACNVQKFSVSDNEKLNLGIQQSNYL